MIDRVKDWAARAVTAAFPDCEEPCDAIDCIAEMAEDLLGEMQDAWQEEQDARWRELDEVLGFMLGWPTTHGERLDRIREKGESHG